ncbi:hypothetical protein GCM10011409_39440 [Lentibacillus populi]|uniref:Lipoprotein n=1 Tax=Lentibacillus populi TaxID=1827502 RepID=A0A9W5X7A8_9BACI|nr:hypothetical protein [Lentibacillus populi]GGB58044.1 hypothetical protein GCM10011409_39440 [Lentibacillus populi]
MKILSMIIGITLVVSLSGCSNSDEVTNELIEYHNDSFLTFKAMKEEEFMSKVGEYIKIVKKGDDQVSADFLEEEMLPKLNEVLDYLKGVEPDHKEVRELNELLIEAEEAGYKAIKEGTELAGIKEGETNEKMLQIDKYENELQEMYDSFLERRDELMEKYDIHWVEENGEDGKRIKKMERDAEH